MKSEILSICAAIVASLTFTVSSNSALALEYSLSTVVLAASDGTGDPAPDTGATFCCFPRSDAERMPRINDADVAAFVGFLQGVTGSTDEIIYKEDPGLTLVARDGDPAPDTAAIFSSGIAFNPRGLSLNNSGNVAFTAKLTGEGIPNDQGVWKESSDLGLVARKLDEAPGTNGAQFSGTVTFQDPVISDSGNITFAALLDGLFVDDTNDSGVWKESGKRKESRELSLVVRDGDSVPGIDDAVFGHDVPFGALNSFFVGAMNKHDKIAFRAFVNGPEIGPLVHGVWKERPNGDLALVAWKGGVAPGTNNIVFDGLSTPRLNDAGKVAFIGFAGGFPDNVVGIWKESSSLNVVIRNGDPAPGFPGATFFRFSNLELNNKGLTAFLATTFFGPGLSIWTENFFGGPSLVVALEDTLEVRPADFRTIGPSFQLPLSLGGFNKYGQVGFRTRFTDGTEGLFVATPDPEDLLDRLVNGLVDLDISPGIEAQLLKLLQDPLDLDGFIDKVEGKRGNPIDPDDADRLIDAAEQIDGLLNS